MAPDNDPFEDKRAKEIKAMSETKGAAECENKKDVALPISLHIEQKNSSRKVIFV